MFSIINKDYFLSLYNKTLVFVFVGFFFVNGITRYKHIFFYIMILTCLYYLACDFKFILGKLNNKITYLLLIFSFFLYLSVSYSLLPLSLYKAVNNILLNYGLLSILVIFTILLYKESKESISKLIFYSFIFSLVINILIELVRYYIAYNQNRTLPFTTYDFRGVSDVLVFSFAGLLVSWITLKGMSKIYFLFFSLLFLFVFLGTLSRGAWLAAFVGLIFFIIIFKPWKLVLLGTALLFISLISLKVLYPDTSKLLFHKLEQTSSSHRYENGTQGTAFELIKNNPLLGYGFGDRFYIEKYNSVVDEHPKWIFRESLGPHNIWLYIWFGTGVLGLISFILLVGYSIYTTALGMINNKENKNIFIAYFILFISVFCFYVVRGMFEQAYIKPLGLALGLLVALYNADFRNKAKNTKGESNE
ncbi:O-antigen ligase RfaL [Moellerella wisconsensis]|uniref:O-antigen ligase RfaL n=1 Tax=Moellerella wisconsensis TaxID=158849 RepID=UPI0030766DE6